MFRFVVCYVSVSCNVLYVLCLTVCYVTASRTVLYVFYLLVCYVSGSHPVLYVFCLAFVTLVSRAVFCMCSV